MSTIVATTRITHRYLMNKTKWDLASWIMDDLDRVDDLRERAEKAEAELAALREAQRWIPCTEQIPDDFTPVEVWHIGGTPPICIAHIEVKDFRRWYLSAWNDEKIINVTHWRPLPEPPK